MLQDSIREITKDDIQAVFEIERRSFEEPWRYEALMEETDGDSALFLGLFGSDGTLKAYVCFGFVLNEAELLRLAVLFEYRRQGIAAKLLSHSENILRSYGIDTVFLEVRPCNLPARALYEKIGFERISYRPNYYGDGGGAEIYRKRLPVD